MMLVNQLILVYFKYQRNSLYYFWVNLVSDWHDYVPCNKSSISMRIITTMVISDSYYNWTNIEIPNGSWVMGHRAVTRDPSDPSI